MSDLLTYMKLHEGMVKAKQANKEGLALYVGKGNYGGIAIVLYDQVGFYNDAVDAVNERWDSEEDRYNMDGMAEGWEFYAYEADFDASSHMRGMIEFNGDKGCPNQIVQSAAQNRYGPLMYEIAMAFSPHGIIPDNDVSAAAKRVWTKFYRRKDITKVPVDNPKCTNTWGVAMKLKRKMATGKLQARHKELVRDMVKLGKLAGLKTKDSDVDMLLSTGASDLFQGLYR